MFHQQFGDPVNEIGRLADLHRMSRVDGKLIIDNTTPHGPAVDHGTITLRAGQRYPITLEHTEQGGEASMKLIWSSPNVPQQVVPANRLYR